jgi:hypothetical protein
MAVPLCHSQVLNQVVHVLMVTSPLSWVFLISIGPKSYNAAL